MSIQNITNPNRNNSGGITLGGVKQGITGLTIGQGAAVKDAAALDALVQSLTNSGASAKDAAALKELVQSLTGSDAAAKDMAALKELVQSLGSSGASTKDMAALNALVQNLIGSGQGLPEGAIDPQMSAEMAKMRAEQAFLQATLDQTDLAIEAGSQTDRAELESTREVERQPERIVDDKIWEMLLAWRQNSQLSAEQNLKQLQALFQMLLKEIMTDYRGEMQLQLLAQLDSLTMNAIKQMMFERSSDLLDFLGQYGRPGTNQQIMDSLFEAVAGRKPISLSSESFGPEGLLSSSRGQGVIYQKDSRGIRLNADYQNRIDRSENRQNQAAELLRRNNASDRGLLTGREDFALQQSGRGTSTASFSTRDISQAQQFIQYLRLNFPELDAEELPYTSEEFIGFSSGIMALKAQTFMDKKGMGSGMSSALKYALDSYIQSQFFQNAQTLKQSSSFRDKSSSLSLKADDFQKVYHFMVNTYQDKKDAQAAVLAGLQKASESFHEKQKDSVFQKAARYFSDTGFFSHSEIDDLEKEILDGWKAICKDWNEFLKFAQIPADRSLRFQSNIDYNFYMAILLAYERATQAKDSTKIPKTIPYMVKWGAAIVIVGAGTVILYSMFF